MASPPTNKYQETLTILKELGQRHPNELRLVVFKRGIDLFPTEASMGMKNLMQKSIPVPALIVNGVVLCKVEYRIQMNWKREYNRFLLILAYD